MGIIDLFLEEEIEDQRELGSGKVELEFCFDFKIFIFGFKIYFVKCKVVCT